MIVQVVADSHPVRRPLVDSRAVTRIDAASGVVEVSWPPHGPRGWSKARVKESTTPNSRLLSVAVQGFWA